MIQWQHLFGKSIVERGLEYYNNDAVSDLQIKGNKFCAVVNGTFPYYVEINISGNVPRRLYCSCPYAQDGNKCKHMAAVLFKISALELDGKLEATALNQEYKAPSREIAHKLITPFARSKDDDTYRYFDTEAMAEEFDIYEDTFEKAKELSFRKGASGGNAELSFFYSNTTHDLNGQISESTGRYLPTRITFDRNSIIRASCEVPGCRCYYTMFYSGYSHSYRNAKYEPCEHILSLFILADDYIKTHNIGDSTDSYALNLMRFYSSMEESSPSVSNDADGKVLSLIPKIREKYGALYASFKIGPKSGKMYVVKDASAMHDICESKGTYEMGKNLTIDFSKDTFDDKSTKYYGLLSRFSKDEELRALEYGEGYKKVKDLRLGASTLDDFFDIALGDEIETDIDDFSPSKAALKFSAPEISLSIAPDRDDKGVFHGIVLSGYVPQVYDGVSGHYYFDEPAKAFCRIPADDYLRLLPIFKVMHSGENAIHIGRRYLSDFYYDVLPALRKTAYVDSPEEIPEIDSLIPEEFIIRFYLDAIDGAPICKGEAVYGDTAYVLSDLAASSEGTSGRAISKESTAFRAMRRYFPYQTSDGNYACSVSEKDIYELITEGVDYLNRFGEVLSTPQFDALKVKRKISVSVGVRIDSDLLDLTIGSQDVSMDELYELLKSYKQKKKYHRLASGEFVSIDETVEELSDLFDTLHLTPKEFIRGNTEVPAYRALYLDKMLEGCENIYAKRDSHFKNLIKGFKTISDSDFEVPDELKDVLRTYQVYGHKWLRTLSAYSLGGILADEMGLGKTLQIISVLLSAKNDGAIGTSIVVCPASLIYNWKDEFEKYAPSLSVMPVVGTQAERGKIIDKYAKWDVLITSYDLLKRDVSLYEDCAFLYEVIDEAQYIKTHTTSASKSVKVLKSRYRFALTGTPIENRLSELWSIFDFLMPGFLYGYDTFKKELETPITKNHDENASARLKKMVSPFILRRLKTDVLKDLPEKTEEVHSVKFSTEQQKLYDGQVVHMKQMLSSEDPQNFSKDKIKILAELTKIRQICCDPSLLFENYDGESAKREACIDLIHSAIEGEHRILLFSQFTSMLDLLKKDLDSEGIEYYEITGATPKHLRLDLVNKFNTGSVPLFLISLKAGGTGLNLTGADIVIHYDPWWNAAAQNQATDRAHRIGQTKPVTVYKLIVKNSIEEKILKMQEMKLSLADEILSGESTSIGSLSKEELLELLS